MFSGSTQLFRVGKCNVYIYYTTDTWTQPSLYPCECVGFMVSKACGYYLVRFSCSPPPTDQITQPKMCVLPQQINLESFAPTGSKIRPPLIQLWLSEAHVCWFLNQIHTCRFSHSCSLLSVGQLFVFEDVVQSLSSMCLCDVFSLILTEACTPSNLGVQLRK